MMNTINKDKTNKILAELIEEKNKILVKNP